MGDLGGLRRPVHLPPRPHQERARSPLPVGCLQHHPHDLDSDVLANQLASSCSCTRVVKCCYDDTQTDCHHLIVRDMTCQAGLSADHMLSTGCCAIDLQSMYKLVDAFTRCLMSHRAQPTMQEKQIYHKCIAPVSSTHEYGTKHQQTHLGEDELAQIGSSGLLPGAALGGLGGA